MMRVIFVKRVYSEGGIVGCGNTDKIARPQSLIPCYVEGRVIHGALGYNDDYKRAYLFVR